MKVVMRNKTSFDKEQDYYSAERKEIISIFPADIETVLDVGCGRGVLGSRLKEKNLAASVVGIEINREAAESARERVDQVIIADAEKGDFELKDKYFDIIIFADILEHLKDPWSALSKFKRYLKDDGYMLLSIPNVRYYRIPLNILFRGRFDYEESGILDIMHLRFFTFKTIKSMLKDSSLVIDKLYRNFSGIISKLFNTITLNIFADIFTRQYIILVKKMEVK